ncbi:hypothetical protein OAU50_08260 [Planctomycetota bacterium]|nr:hypothetical protein [Planctomycetota bacterium]
MKISLSILVVVLMAGCADTDPYKRPNPAYTGFANEVGFVNAYNNRWPKQFKSVQTVTIDFGPVTKTLVGYLVVQGANCFRLNAMTEQGVTIFELAHHDGFDSFKMNTSEFDEAMLDNVSRDIQRVFLHQIATPGKSGLWESASFDTKFVSDETGAEFGIRGRYAIDSYRMVGNPAKPDRETHRLLRYDEDYETYRVDYYEYSESELTYPQYIVLRERALRSGDRPYKLTIHISELTPREKPWPAKLFVIPKEMG